MNEGFLRDMKSDQRNFARRSPTNLFIASTHVNDKDGKLREREMTLPCAFFSREGLDDSTHAMLELTDNDSEDAEVDKNASGSMMVSESLVSGSSLGLESETNRDSPIFLGNCATENLNLVENAILRLLQEDGHSYLKQHKENSTKFKDALGVDEHLEGSEQTQSSIGIVDFRLLSRLLDQVQTLKERKYHHRQLGRTARPLSYSRSVWDICKHGEKEKDIKKDDMTKAIEDATQAAKLAADAAKNASSLVTKNAQALGKLIQSLHPSTSKSNLKKREKKTSLGLEDPEHTDSSSNSEDSSDSDDVKDIVKKIVSQNRYTHVVLGIMLVSSFVWRYIVVNLVKRVKIKVSDPWDHVGGILFDNFKGLEKDKDKEKAYPNEECSNGLNMSQLNLPLLVNGELHHHNESSTFDVKEERILTLGNIMQSKLKNST